VEDWELTEALKDAAKVAAERSKASASDAGVLATAEAAKALTEAAAVAANKGF
jgi:hypothetical protein